MTNTRGENNLGNAELSKVKFTSVEGEKVDSRKAEEERLEMKLKDLNAKKGQKIRELAKKYELEFVFDTEGKKWWEEINEPQIREELEKMENEAWSLQEQQYRLRLVLTPSVRVLGNKLLKNLIEMFNDSEMEEILDLERAGSAALWELKVIRNSK